MKTVCLIFVFLGLAIIGIEIINDFEKLKTFYASFNPQEYYYKDTLFVDEQTSPSSGGSNKTSWIFYGHCKSDKSKNGISISFSIVEDEEKIFDRTKIPIWRITIVKDKILYRDKNDVINSPFSYEMRSYWGIYFLILLILPSFIYYLYLRNQDNKNKIK